MNNLDHNHRIDLIELVVRKLKSTTGIVECELMNQEDRETLRQLETESNRRLGLPGMEAVNEGIKDVLSRQYVIATCHSPELRHPPGPVLVISDEESIVGEEIADSKQIERLSADPNAILLGRSLVLYRDALARAKGRKLKLVYRALRFPELDDLPHIKDVISVTVGIPAHLYLARKAGWNTNDPSLGTVLIGFNKS